MKQPIKLLLAPNPTFWKKKFRTEMESYFAPNQKAVSVRDGRLFWAEIGFYYRL
jgi:hypothetical protein